MKRKRWTEEQIVYVLKQAESGVKVAELIRTMGLSEQTCYRWKKQYSGLGVNELRELKQLCEENAKLKSLVANLSLDKHILQEIVSKKALKPARKRELVDDAQCAYQISRSPLQQAKSTNEQWSMDFVHDRTEDRRPLRVLCVVDNYSRECLLLYAARSTTGQDVAVQLEKIAARRGYPQSIRVDNGTEFYSKAMDQWAYLRGVDLECIRPGKPVENAYIESSNSRLRDEYLNLHLFFSVEDAQMKLDQWKEDYNHVRPHGSFGNRTPSEMNRTPASFRSPTAPCTIPGNEQRKLRLVEALN